MGSRLKIFCSPLRIGTVTDVVHASMAIQTYGLYILPGVILPGVIGRDRSFPMKSGLPSTFKFKLSSTEQFVLSKAPPGEIIIGDVHQNRMSGLGCVSCAVQH